MRRHVRCWTTWHMHARSRPFGSKPPSGVTSLGRFGALFATLFLASCGMSEEPSRLKTNHPPPVSSGVLTIEARQPLLPMYPCSRCHAERAPNSEERMLTELHTQKILNHGGQGGWCYRCHARDDIDKLRLSDGKLVSFDQAYELCGSCHGDKLRDWNAGIHGLTTGYWLGDRFRRSCPSCQDRQLPKVPQTTPEKQPQPPRTAPPEAANEEHEKARAEHH